jgi:putative MATE family efflux protein
MLRLALPVLAEQLLFAMVMLVDVWLTGRFLKEAPELAAIGLIAYLLWFLTSLFDCVAIGSTALTARFIGSGNIENARLATNQSLLIGIVVASIATVMGLWLVRPAVALLGLENEAAQLAVQYLDYILPVLPVIMIQRVGIACLRGAGDMITAFWVMSVVNLVNIIVSCVLVIGIGPFPTMNWDGLAIGTAAAYLTGGLLVLLLLVRGHSGLGIEIHMMRPVMPMIRKLLNIGIPGGVNTLSIIGCNLWFVSLINRLGNDAAAAHNVAIRLESLGFLPGAAFATAAATLTGQYLGAGDKYRAGRSVLMACLTACGIMTSVGITFYFGGLPLADFFLAPEESAIAEQAAQLLQIAGLAMLPLAIEMVLIGALRGAGDTRWPLLFTFVGFLGIRIPLTYLAIDVFHWGVVGAWYAMLIDLVARCLMVVYRFYHGGWKHVQL